MLIPVIVLFVILSKLVLSALMLHDALISADPVYIVGLVAVLVALAVLMALEVGAELAPSRFSFLRNIRQSLLGACFILGLSLSAALFKDLGLWDGEMVKRSAGIVLGFVLLVTGNYIPKTQVKRASQTGTRISLKAHRRVGQVFVIAGLAWVMTWLFVPASFAANVSTGLGVIAFIVAIAYGARCKLSSQNRALS